MSDEYAKLWVKDSVNHFYIDIFHKLKRSSQFHDCVVQIKVNDKEKDESLANEYRQSGNELFDKGGYNEAIEMYNKSLCFARNDQLGLVYADRAFCFLNLGMHHECLADIELAKRANYPVSQMSNLEQRKSFCLCQMGASSTPPPLEPKMSFEEDDNMPCVANVLAIKRHPIFDRLFLANCDIEEDKVVLIEKPLVKFFNGDNFKRCHKCLQRNTNLVPCRVCTKALFCDGPCITKNYHQYECNMQFLKCFEGKSGRLYQNCVQFLIRMVVVGLETNETAQELMTFVEGFRAQSSRADVILNDGTANSMLGVCLTHLSLVPYAKGQIKTLIIACIAFDIIMDRPDLAKKFQAIDTQRFLMHYLTHLAAMFIANNILLQSWSYNMIDIIQNDGKETFGVALFNLSTYFNHNCMPNAVRLTTSNHVIIKTIRPIKKGEQICVRYGIDPLWSTSKRRRHLYTLCAFYCNCELCSSDGPSPNEMPIVKSEFDNLAMEMTPLIFSRSKDAEKWQSIKDKLFKFVIKYEYMPITSSIIQAYEFIKMIINRDLFYSTSF
ncbi:SET and MYND domain-containing protein 4 [Pseudolycoriella hygida]|uniref:SET and MYND domain-containing protein 4 n=1 Tax=Pseudolycoriella hygida TaxID=35572 RepID=A0A9Q0RZ96_9DIPT|nr:SET and MYND domain-containing protein 4 [Pseudolycoriella hygida]